MPSIEEKFQTLADRYANYYGQERVDKPFALNSGIKPAIIGPGGYATDKEILFNVEAIKHHAFLSKVNVMPRKQQIGGSYRLGSQGRNTRTNDTKAGNERRLGSFKAPVSNQYKMEKAHYDFGVHDDDLDEMSEFPNWHQDYRHQFHDGFNNDRLIIGIHGLEHVTTSNLTDNELLEDVNVGWFEQLRQRASSQIHTGNANGEVHIGKDGHYKNLDHYVQDLFQAIPMHKRDPGMEAMIGASLIGMSEGVYYAEQGLTPTEKRLVQEKTITGVYGGLKAQPVDYFFLNGICITSMKSQKRRGNLSIYWQKGKWRRAIKYKPELETTADYNMRREAYHIEDLEKVVFSDVEKVVFLDVPDQNGNPVEILKLPQGKFQEL